MDTVESTGQEMPELGESQPNHDKINDKINQLTMELMVSKSTYHKIIKKVNPAKAKQLEEYLDKLKYHEVDIRSMFDAFMKNQHNAECLPRDVTEAFEHFAKTCIQHIELSEMPVIYKNPYDADSEEAEEDETLFGNMEEEGTKSYWGPKIAKVSGKNISYLLNI